MEVEQACGARSTYSAHLVAPDEVAKEPDTAVTVNFNTNS